jgi:hypothetical protein
VGEFEPEVTHKRVEKLAYALWEGRGRPLGSPGVDWLRAEKILTSSEAGLGTEFPLYCLAMEANEEPSC